MEKSFKKGYDHVLKLIMIGDCNVGKTCILNRFSGDGFSSSYMNTVGIDFKIKTIDIDGSIVKVQVWDTAGQEKFKTITQSYYKGAMGIILVYDSTDPITFSNVESWMQDIDDFASKDCVRILAGNKSDKENIMISTEKGQELADKYKIDFFETSAKTGHNVNDLFYEMTRNILIQKGKIKEGASQFRAGSVSIRPSQTSQPKDDPSCCA
ncbi:unnamed protein product [Moneuplotes crassus]|uniref:Uncharacterized protein n=1 Tax=Euplotes crassus TaxID=5936 RepID=A0AAD1XSL3_EUPCR|nr:unnamed protein product [Moneuplotes crassus]